MSRRRIFEVDFMCSDNFCRCSQPAKLLYIYMCLNSDDEGFCSGVMQAMFFAGASDINLQELKDKNLIYEFDSGVACIKHWHVHNLIRADRVKATLYQKEKAMLEVINNVYQWRTNDNQLTTKCQPNDNQMTSNVGQMSAQVKLSKDKISKVIKEEVSEEESGQQVSTPTPEKTTRFIPPSQQDVENYIAEHGYHVDAERFILFYSSKGWMVGKNKMKDWKAAVQTWEKSWKADHPNGTATQTKKPEKESNSTFDIDEFFNLAVAHTRKAGSQ